MQEYADSEEALSRDALFSMLRNERRREVIHYLSNHEGPVALRELSEYIAGIENDCTAAEVTYKQRKRVQTALYQMHLPKLAEQGIVEYDKRAGTVSLAQGAAECRPYLETRTSRSVRWWKWYLGVAAVASIPVGLAGLGVAPFAAVSGLVYAALARVAFTAVTLAQVVRTRL
ncbi:MAG: hypothetical protein ABEJ82_02800 [Haloplanus sp.]